MKSNISVIGAGVAGLASAIRLASRGHSVTVYEKSEVPGGKIGQIQWNGYRWDTGPSLFTLPELMEELYEMAGERMEDSIEYKRLDVITKYFYEDGMQITAYGDPEEFIREVEEKTGESAPRVRRFLRKSETIYNLTKDVFIFGVFNSIKTFISRSFIKAALQIHKLDVFSSMHRAIEKRIRSGHLVQLFDRYATYNGSNPFRAPATLNVISHLEHNLGAYFPEKGMRALADELYRLAVRSGVTFHFNSPVEAIHMDRNTVNGIQVKGKFVSSDIVVSDIDIYYLYKDLLQNLPWPEKYFKAERSTSALIFYWAMDTSFRELDLHNIFFSKHYRKEFDHLFEHRTITDDPTVYVFISSKAVPEDAPAGCENWFTMINVSENTGQDWDMEIEKARTNILDKLERMLDRDIRSHIVYQHVRDPRVIEEDTSSYRGSLYGNSSNSKFAAFNRHPNRRKDIRGLYFAGGSVHPGGGIPLCLASAKIVDSLIAKDV